MGWVLFLLHGAQVALSASGGYFSYIAITNLQQWEGPAKKAANYSGTADSELQMTRKTQAAGALSLLLSFGTSAYLVFNSFNPNWWQMVFSVLNAGATTGARAYMTGFWQGKTAIPLAEGYNQGIRNSNQVNQFLQYLTFSWVMSSIMTFAGSQ